MMSHKRTLRFQAVYVAVHQDVQNCLSKNFAGPYLEKGSNATPKQVTSVLSAVASVR